VDGIIGHESTDLRLNSCSAVMAQFLIYQWLVTPTRDRGLSQIWCQNREFADLFPIRGTTQEGGRRRGFERVRPLAGGLEAWHERGFPLTSVILCGST
jgi:hypothetical protein